MNSAKVESSQDASDASKKRRVKSRSRLKFYCWFLLTVVVFAAFNAWSEYDLAKSSKTYRIVAGKEVPLSKSELFDHYFLSTFFASLVSGGIFISITCIPAIWFSDMTQRRSRLVVTILAMPFGIMAGAFSSILVWFVLGGWGPPALPAAALAGAIITPALTLTRRSAAINSQF